jgi:hypothetical protein
MDETNQTTYEKPFIHINLKFKKKKLNTSFIVDVEHVFS